MEKCASQHMSSSSSSDSRWHVDCIEPHSPSPPILAIPSGPCMVAPEPPLLGELPGSIEPRADLSVPRMPGSRGIGQASAVSQHLARVSSLTLPTSHVTVDFGHSARRRLAGRQLGPPHRRRCKLRELNPKAPLLIRQGRDCDRDPLLVS